MVQPLQLVGYLLSVVYFMLVRWAEAGQLAAQTVRLIGLAITKPFGILSYNNNNNNNNNIQKLYSALYNL